MCSLFGFIVVLLGNGFAVDTLENQCRQPCQGKTCQRQKQSQRESIACLGNQRCGGRGSRRCRLHGLFGDGGILHNHALYLAGGKHGKGNILCNFVVHHAGHAIGVRNIFGGVEVVHRAVQRGIAVSLPAGKGCAVGGAAAHIPHGIKVNLGDADFAQGAVIFHNAV